MKLSALFIAALPLASAWRLQLYRNAGYVDEIEDRSGKLSQPCKTLSAANRNQASSMKWDGDTIGPFECEIILYNSANCKEAGGILGRSEGDWNVRQFSAQANNKVESYEINC